MVSVPFNVGEGVKIVHHSSNRGQRCEVATSVTKSGGSDIRMCPPSKFANRCENCQKYPQNVYRPIV